METHILTHLTHNASDGPMTAIVYFGEMLAESLGAIALLDSSPFGISSAPLAWLEIMVANSREAHAPP
jgi:hypothetical protein